MAIGDDFSITPQLDGTSEIDYVGGGSTYYPGIEFYRWLQDLADDAIFSGDDIMDISLENPASRATDKLFTMANGHYLTPLAFQHLYDASITQRDGDEFYGGLTVLGTTENSGGVIQIVQDGQLVTDFWTGGGENADPANNILLQIMLPGRLNGHDIDGGRILTKIHHLTSTFTEFSTTLSPTAVAVSALSTVNDLNNQTSAGTIATWSDIVITEGLTLLDVDNDTINEEYYTSIDLGSRSQNDFYERAKWITREGSAETIFGLDGELFRGITHSWAYDAESGNFTEGETIAWGTSFAFDNGSGTFSLGEYVTFGSGAVGKVVYYSGAGATGTMWVSKEPGSGTIVDNDPIVGITSAATADVAGAVTGNTVVGGQAVLLALDDDGTTGNMYVQLLTGVAPLDNDPIIGQTSTEDALVNGSPTSRPVPAVFAGTTTGSNLIGAYGIGVDPADLNQNDLLTDLGNNPRQPPNNVTFTVNGLVAAEDNILVGPRLAGVLNTSQFTGATGSNAAAAGTWVVNEAIPSDTPSTGTVRVYDGDSYQRVPYTSFTGSTFTLTGTLPTAGASHQFAYDNEGSGPFSEGETLTFGGGGTAELLKLRDNGADGYMVVRMLTGADPIDNDTISGGTSSATADVAGAPAEVGGYISYIDKVAAAASETFTVVYLANRDLFVRARDGGTAGDLEPIVPFETVGTLTNTGGSATVIRNADV